MKGICFTSHPINHNLEADVRRLLITSCSIPLDVLCMSHILVALKVSHSTPHYVRESSQEGMHQQFGLSGVADERWRPFHSGFSASWSLTCWSSHPRLGNGSVRYRDGLSASSVETLARHNGSGCNSLQLFPQPF